MNPIATTAARLGWVVFDIHPAETSRAEVTRQAAARFARQQVNKAA
jgi:hypothetical protein